MRFCRIRRGALATAAIAALAAGTLILGSDATAASRADASGGAANRATSASLKRITRRVSLLSKHRRSRPRQKPSRRGPGVGRRSSPKPQPQPSPRRPAPRGATGSVYGISFDNPEYLDAATRNRELDAIAGMGARWIRFDIKWSDVQWDGPASFNWSKYDPLVDAARARGFTILADLAYSPTWARPAGTNDKFGPDTDERRSAFAAFAEAAVRHFAGRVGHWEVWNEPNGPMFWAPRPKPADYAALLDVAYARIKAADPGAYVLAGATAPASSDGTWIDEVEFVSAVYGSGGKGDFDGWSHHPYTVSPTFAHNDNAWYQVFGTSPSIRSVMAANGDAGKLVWGTEFGPPTSGGPNAMSEAEQADQVTKAYGLWRSHSWAGPLFVYTQRDKRPYGASADSFDYYGMLRYDFSPKPVWTAYRAMAAT